MARVSVWIRVLGLAAGLAGCAPPPGPGEGGPGAGGPALAPGGAEPVSVQPNSSDAPASGPFYGPTGRFYGYQ